MLEQEHGPGPEESTSTTKSRTKLQSQCSARAQSWSPGHSPSSRYFAPEDSGWEGSKKARSEGKEV